MYDLKSSIYLKSNYIPVRTYEVIAIAGLLCVIIYGIYSGMQIPTIVAYISIYAAVSFRILPSINRIITSSNNLASRSHVLDYLIDSKANKEIAKRQTQLAFNWTIELSKADFSYPDRDPVLRAVSLQIPKGQFIGFLGSSGSGKSTLLHIVSSLLPTKNGALRIDGVEVDSSNLTAYRYLFSYVNQDIFMLNESILTNISFSDDNPNLDKVNTCLKRVNLYRWVDSLPNGIYTSIGELGGK